jgi:hypothetical protein
MTIGPILVLPDFNKPFIVEYDASSLEIGVILMQETTSHHGLSKYFLPIQKETKHVLSTVSSLPFLNYDNLYGFRCRSIFS